MTLARYIAACLIAFATGAAVGWRSNTMWSFFKHRDYCPASATTRAVQGCEATINVIQNDMLDSKMEFYRCEATKKALERTVDCLMFPHDCRTPSPDEVGYNGPTE